MTYGEYYQTKYNVTIRNHNQPLLIAKNEKTGTEIALVPELCEMTGLTDTHRANFNLMKELSGILHKPADVRTKEVQSLIQEMEQQPKIKRMIDEWQIEFDQKPFCTEGQRIVGGNIQMGPSGPNG